ncbi:AraC family transcriptional regulator [Shinella sp.]|uniref:helix-turn-helix transcriptional regulator n=1 Tax=Shinella sp. TaxID=1870904 RepID=UPI00258B8FB8|nr:AraC family transcriptional regulator [Shinella sp.]MCW5708838.1 helix-turn-helix transcriptional regulator [Shinella sp.]
MAAAPGNAGNEGKGGRVRVRDFLRHDGIAFDSPDDRLSPDDTLMKGKFLHRELRRGLVLHVSDAIEERAFTATSLLPEELSCIFFLEGSVDLSIGDRRFAFQADRSAVRGVAIMNACPENFERASRGGQHLRHLVVSATPEWLHRDALEAVADTTGGARLLRDHLSEHRWTLTPRMMELVRQIFSPSPLIPELRDLYLEGRAVELVAETMAAVLQADRRGAGGTLLSRQDAICLSRARDFIAARATEALSVETIAREAGISASGLQRLFRVAENRSVFDYVRNIRLERAFAALDRENVTVQEASAIAGYTSAANFATAFRRRFGIVPTAVRKADPR